MRRSRCCSSRRAPRAGGRLDLIRTILKVSGSTIIVGRFQPRPSSYFSYSTSWDGSCGVATPAPWTRPMPPSSSSRAANG